MPRLYTPPAAPVCKPHLLQRIPVGRIAAPASLPTAVTSRNLHVQHDSRTVHLRSKRIFYRAAAPAAAIKATEAQPWWRQLPRVALLLPVIAAAAFLKPPVSSAQTAWQFWQRQPSAQQQVQPAAWARAENFSAAAAGRWHRTVQSTAARTATVVLFTFTVFYTLTLSFQEAPPTPKHWRTASHHKPAAQQRSAPRRKANRGSQLQQRFAAAAAGGLHSRSSSSPLPAKLSSPQLPSRAPLPFLSAHPPPLFSPMTLPAVEPNWLADEVPDSRWRATGTVSSRPMLASSAARLGHASTDEAPQSRSAAAGEEVSSSGAPEPPSSGGPAGETLDMPADQVPPVTGVGEKVRERAKQLEEEEKAALSPGTVLPPTEEANRDQGQDQPQASAISAPAHAFDHAAGLATLPERAILEQSAQQESQADDLLTARKGGAFRFDSAAADDVLKSALRANPVGDMLDGLLRHQPTSHKLSDLYTKPDSSKDHVNSFLRQAAAQAGQGTPKSGPVHDFLHIADAAHAPERRPAPGLLTALLKAEETQAPTPKQGLVHELLHISDHVGTLADDLGQVNPLRADPIGDGLKAVSSVADLDAQEWDPVAMGLKTALADRSKATPDHDPVASLGAVQEHSPIKRPSKYDPLPGVLTGPAPSAKRTLDPFGSLMALALARGNAREAARAKRAAVAAPAPPVAQATSAAADPAHKTKQLPQPHSIGKESALNGHSNGVNVGNGASNGASTKHDTGPGVLVGKSISHGARYSSAVSQSNDAQMGKQTQGAVQLAEVMPASNGAGRAAHVEAPVLLVNGVSSNGAHQNGMQKSNNGVAVKGSRRLVNVRVYQGNTTYLKGRG